MRTRKGIVIANWKMNPPSVGDAKKLFLDVKASASRLSHTRVVVCPPVSFLAELRKLYIGKKIEFGVQNIYFESHGSFTGETSALMAQSVGATYTIVGHSERRAMGETNEMVNKKVQVALNEKLAVILCIGERERDRHGEYLAFLKEELLSALLNVPRASLKNIFITYEPIWAIGKTDKDAMKPSEVHETVLYIRKLLAETYDKKIAFALPILYGGSVEAENCEALMREGEIGGFLVGHASLSPTEFDSILSTVNTLSK